MLHRTVHNRPEYTGRTGPTVSDKYHDQCPPDGGDQSIPASVVQLPGKDVAVTQQYLRYATSSAPEYAAPLWHGITDHLQGGGFTRTGIGNDLERLSQTGIVNGDGLLIGGLRFFLTGHRTP